MKITDILREDSEDTGDYQQMLARVTRANRVGGVPDEQQIPLALFKELKKQQQQNRALSSELSAAEQRINQALSAGELSKQELGMHRGELDRERAAGERQQAAVGQLGQQYANREKASDEQIKQLTSQLDTIKAKPGVDPKAAEELEKQIQELGKKSVSADQLQDLESTIANIQNMQSVDDAEIQNLMAQIDQAQKASRDLEKSKQSVGRDVEKAAQDAIDQVEQMRQDLARLDQVAGQLSSVVSDALPAKLDSLNARLQELDSESEHQYDELLKHDNLLNQLTGRGGNSDDGGVGQEIEEPEPIPPTRTPPVAPTTPGVSDDQDELDQDQASRAAALAAMARAQISNPDMNPDWPRLPKPEKEPEAMAESRFQHHIKWATGKKL